MVRTRLAAVEEFRAVISEIEVSLSVSFVLTDRFTRRRGGTVTLHRQNAWLFVEEWIASGFDVEAL